MAWCVESRHCFGLLSQASFFYPLCNSIQPHITIKFRLCAVRATPNIPAPRYCSAAEPAYLCKAAGFARSRHHDVQTCSISIL